jgi:lysyl-tRNA synthetase, class II
MSITNTNHQTIVEAGIIEANDQVRVRIEHLRTLEEIFGNAYPSKFERSRVSGSEDTITNLLSTEPIVEVVKEINSHIAGLQEGEKISAELKNSLNERLRTLGNVRIAGRLTTPPRVMGKAAFVHLSDGISRLQVYLRKGDFTIIKQSQEAESEKANSTTQADLAWKAFQMIDHGDFIGVEGFLFLTNTGELTVHVEKFQFLAKALLPMPDKMHGVADPELRQRRRYVDLIASSLQIEHEGLTTRQVFERRAKIISSIRKFLDENGYIEVETPMLTPIASGAAARPFITHHNALDIDLYARIAPELYLKRLLVGGFEKVYELGRNFRNEGISYKHNPEFTMLEFYCAYMDANQMMDFCERLLQRVLKEVIGDLKIVYEGNKIDFGKFEKLTMKDAIKRYSSGFSDFNANLDLIPGDNMLELFEEIVEPNLIQPTFIVGFPKSISPLSKASSDGQTAERFELFIGRLEIANGFSELNDPQEQYERFIEQMKQREKGDEEAMMLDEDYIRALSYGMPPAAGIGIGIDRLVMLLTNKHSIRDVILFPHLRPEKSPEKAEQAG